MLIYEYFLVVPTIIAMDFDNILIEYVKVILEIIPNLVLLSVLETLGQNDLLS